MVKPYFTRYFKLLTFVISVLVVISLLQHYIFFSSDFDADRIEKFYYEDKNSLDVVFMGNSRVFCNFSPGYAYDQYGFTSYMYALSNNPGSLYKAQLKEILSRQNPQIIFVEVAGFLISNDSSMYSEIPFTKFIEHIPKSENWLSTILEYPCEDKLNYIMPLIKYHGNWLDPSYIEENITRRQQKYNSPSLLKGVYTYTSTYDPALFLDDAQYSYSLSDDSLQMITQFLEFCRQEKLDNIVFTYFPNILLTEKWKACYSSAKELEDIIHQYGYPFLDLQTHVDEIGLNFDTDYWEAEHANVYGQRKITDYLGRLITTDFQLNPIEQTAANKSQWEKSAMYAEKFYHYADQCLQEGVSLLLEDEQDLIPILDEYHIPE